MPLGSTVCLNSKKKPPDEIHLILQINEKKSSIYFKTPFSGEKEDPRTGVREDTRRGGVGVGGVFVSRQYYRLDSNSPPKLS